MVWRHALPNALVPIVTVVGLQFGALLAGAIVTEKIFSWPGLGRLVVDAISNRDYALVQGCLLVDWADVCAGEPADGCGVPLGEPAHAWDQLLPTPSQGECRSIDDFRLEPR